MNGIKRWQAISRSAQCFSLQALRTSFFFGDAHDASKWLSLENVLHLFYRHTGIHPWIISFISTDQAYRCYCPDGSFSTAGLPIFGLHLNMLTLRKQIFQELANIIVGSGYPCKYSLSPGYVFLIFEAGLIETRFHYATVGNNKRVSLRCYYSSA